MKFNRRFVMPLALGSFGLAVTAACALFFFAVAERQDELRLARQADTTAQQVAERLETYIIMLRGIEGLAADGPPVTSERFRGYVGRLGVRETYPGVQGLGFALALRADDYASASTALAASGFAVPALWPDGEREQYTAIILLEPQDERNLAAMAFDMASEPRRRAAMLAARAAGEPRITLPIELVQEIDADVQPGFLVYLPVYRDENADGVADFLGWSYSPFRAHDFFSSALGDNPRQAEIAVIDQAADGFRLYQTADWRDRSGGMMTSRRITLAGADWRIDVQPGPAFFASSQRRYVWVVVFAGLLITAGLVAFSMVRENAAARLGLAYEEARRAHETSEVLLREVNHRIGNSLSMIAAMVRMQARETRTEEARIPLEETGHRIMAIGQVHRDLYTSEDVSSVALDRYLAGLLDSLISQFGEDGGRIAMTRHLTAVEAAPDAAICLGVIVSELVTNARKYAFGEAGGTITVTLEAMPEGEVHFSLYDDGRGFTTGGAQGTGLGTKIIEAMAARLGSKAEWSHTRGRTGLSLRFMASAG